MTGGVFTRTITRFGAPMTAVDAAGAEAGTAPALVQPLREREDQRLPTPLGRRRTDRLLCLSHPDLPLDTLGERGFVRWQGEEYRIITTQKVLAGRETAYRWALLRPREEE